ncbi:MAG: amidohydrolase family protein [Gemmatimonadetes bacterium]|nr:amidohydrolase family protein [Gemmatimonadota bacterium]
MRVYGRFLLLTLAVLASTRCGSQPAPYDLAIVGGRVIDAASGLDAQRTVAVRGGRIAALVEEPVDAAVVIDAAGLVVAPGFLDILAGYPNTDEAAIYKVFDGVTTLVSMHGGPVDVESWYAEREHSGAYVNFGTTVGHTSLREAVGIMDRYAAATAEQIDEMARLARDAIRAGAVGIGFGIMYVPGASREEIFRLFQVAAEEGVPCHLHIRYFGDVSPDANSLAAVEEVLALAAASGASAQVVHIGSMIPRPRSMDVALRMIDGARARGLDVMADIYPYTAASTGLSSAAFDPGWQERYGGIGYGDVELVSNGERLTAASFTRYRAQDTVRVIIHYIPEETVRLALAHPLVMVGSDGVIENGRGHPRGAGTFARVLGRYVREQGALALAQAIEKMTLMPARRLEASVPAMARKGRLSVGADADIIVFDAETVSDQATFDEPARRSAGMRYVFVAGEPVIWDGELREGTKPGSAVRRGS